MKVNSPKDLPEHHRANLERQLKLERETDEHDSFAADVRLLPKPVCIVRKKADNPAQILAFFETHNLPRPVTEHYFHDARKFRFDFAFPAEKVALEVEGGIWLEKSGHNTGKGIERDIEKYNLAAINGWIVLRVQPQDLTTIETIEMIQKVLSNRRETVKLQSIERGLDSVARIVGKLQSEIR